MNEEIANLLSEAPGPDASSAEAVRSRATNVLRPAGALARLDELAVWLAAWQRTSKPAVNAPTVLVFVGDHGVTVEGVSAYPSDVTQAMLKALEEGAATASVMARTIGAAIDVIDVGVGRPTANFVEAPALT